MLMALPNIEFCTSGIATSVIIKNVLKVVSAAQFGILQSCTRAGEIRAYNISYINSSVMAMAPSGSFISALRLYDDIDDNVFNVTYYSTIFH